MRSNSAPSPRLLLGSAWLLAFLIFLPWLPSTVQYGDSGELVANALKLGLSHPPGFPLYQWLYHFILLVPTGLPPYYQAALFTAALMAAAIALAASRLRPIPALMVTALLAVQPVILRQALLPDVFALHALLCALAIHLAQGGCSPGRRPLLLSTTLALAGANHPSAIFLLPLLGTASRPFPGWRQAGTAICVAVAIFLSLYASLLLLQWQEIFSWPANGLLGHLLRSQYGTFRLSAQAGTQVSFGKVLSHFFHHTAWIWLALAATAAATNRYLLIQAFRRNGLLLLSLLFYGSIFYGLVNVRPEGFGDFVLERFHLLPAILLSFLLVELLRNADTLRLALLVPMGVMAAGQSLPANQWQKNTVLEDLALNFRQVAASSRKECVVLLVGGDSIWGALDYLHAINTLPAHMIPVNKGLLTIERYQRRMTGLGLSLRFRATERGEIFDLTEDLLAPNLPRCDFFTLEPLQPPGAETTILPIGRRISAGLGLHFSTAEAGQLFVRGAPPEGRPGYSLDKYFFAQYARLPLGLGLDSARRGDWMQAKTWFARAQATAPYLTVAQKNLCTAMEQLKEESKDCRARLRALEETESAYIPD